MALLGVDKLKKLIEKNALIENLDQDNLNIEGCSIDLRLGEVHEMNDEGGELLLETRNSPDYTLIGKYEKGNEQIIELLPGKVYTLKTIETINTPSNLVAWMIPRYTFYKAGITVMGIKCDPGYKGPFGFTIINTTNKPFKIQMGARYCAAMFHTLDGNSNEYIGQWQGGRTHIKDIEIQTKQV